MSTVSRPGASRGVRLLFRRMVAVCLALTLTFSLGSGCSVFLTPLEELTSSEEETISPLLLLAILYYLSQDSNDPPCAYIPNLTSALPTGTLPTGYASIQGKFVSASGAPVVGAAVFLDNGTNGDGIHYSTHSSIHRDGSFAISGVPTGVNYRLAIESLDTDQFAGRIDSHLDCYLSPTSFTAGWYGGSGDTITTSVPGANITLTDSQTLDVGTINLLD